MVAADEDLEAEVPHSGRRWLIAAIAAVVAIAVGALVISQITDSSPSGNPAGEVADLSDSRTPVEHEYVIPYGTADRIDAGEEVQIMPDHLAVKVGETLRVVNEDYRGHEIGPYFVGKESTLTQTFTQPGQLIGECSLHLSTQLVIDVTR